MHTYWLREAALTGTYSQFLIRRQDLSAALAGLQKSGVVGLNITIPHKEAVYALAHTAGRAAHAARAANVILFRDAGWEVHNTDAEGLTNSLTECLGERAQNVRRAVILGAGGAARAAVIACDTLGVQEICIMNRTASRAGNVVDAMRDSTNAMLSVTLPANWNSTAHDTGLLINASSAGLEGTASPEIALNVLPARAAVCDLVYRPLETPLLARARARGLTTVDGLGMLMHQGALAFELLFGIRPLVTAALRQKLEQAMSNGG